MQTTDVGWIRRNTTLLLMASVLTVLLDLLFIYIRNQDLFLSSSIEEYLTLLVVLLNLSVFGFGVGHLIHMRRHEKSPFHLKSFEVGQRGFDMTQLNFLLQELNPRLEELTDLQVENFKLRIEEVDEVLNEYGKLNSEGKQKVYAGIESLITLLADDLQHALLNVDTSRIDLIERKVKRMQN